jgi:P-type conjugative transfer protein TrbJ
MCLLSSSASATGIPTVDVAAIVQSAMQYSQMLGSASNEEQRNTLYSNRYNQLTQTNQITLNGTLQKLEAKYNQLDSESEDLNDLRSRAANAEGNLEVLQALSDLVAFNTDELRKLRYTIMDQSNAMLTAMAAQNNEKILGKASLDKFSNKTNRTNIYDTKGDARDFAKVK